MRSTSFTVREFKRNLPRVGIACFGLTLGVTLVDVTGGGDFVNCEAVADDSLGQAMLVSASISAAPGPSSETGNSPRRFGGLAAKSPRGTFVECASLSWGSNGAEITSFNEAAIFRSRKGFWPVVYPRRLLMLRLPSEANKS